MANECDGIKLENTFRVMKDQHCRFNLDLDRICSSDINVKKTKHKD